jgi:flagellar motility protein MotE (MotC chaperone)
MRFRLLPLMIGTAVMVLSLRAFDLWHHAGAAFAQNAKPETPAAAPAKPETKPEAKAEPKAETKAETKTETKAKAPAAEPAPNRAAELATNIPEYSEAELAVLQGLAGRREELERRDTDLDQREALLKAAEQRIEAKVQELKQLQGTMEALIRKYDDEEETRKKSLVKIFETMKPAEAARIFEQMDLPILLDIIERMKERNAAPVLAQMHPARAKQVTAEIARRRQPTSGAASPSG